MMRKLLALFFIVLFISSATQAQISKEEYNKMWTAASATYKATTAVADQKKANAIITQMEAKYPKDASVMFVRGVYQFNFLDDQNKALTSFSKAITAKPGYVLAYIYRAKVLAKKGVYEKAIEDLSLALQKEGNNITALSERADNYFLTKDYEKALVDYRALVSLQPENAGTYGDIANTLKLLGKNTEANNLFIDALKTKQADTTELHALYGKYLLGENNFAEAHSHFVKAIHGDKKKLYADDFNSAGVAAYKMKYYINALHYFKEAQKIAPQNFNYYDNAASVNLDLKNYYNIVREALKMLQLEPDNPKANKWMGIGLEKSGRSYYYSTFNLRSGELDAKAATTIPLPDTILFYLPTNEAAALARINSAAYKAALRNYLPDYDIVPDANWPSAFVTDFSQESGYKSKENKATDVKRTISNNKLKVENLTTSATSAIWNTTLVDKKYEDICVSAIYKVLATDEDAITGVKMLNDNEAYYYFLVNPVKKKIFIAEWYNNKYAKYQDFSSEPLENIPEPGEEMRFKIITQNRELAFIINDKIIKTFDLALFPNINTLHDIGFHVEGKATIEVSALTAAYSPARKAEIDLLTLNWRQYTRPNTTPTKKQTTTEAPTPNRYLLGTMLIYADGNSKYPVAEVFEIWGDNADDKKVLFSKMVKKLNTAYTYSRYEWKSRQSARQVTKGWDLRNYQDHGAYYTTGQKVN